RSRRVARVLTSGTPGAAKAARSAMRSANGRAAIRPIDPMLLSLRVFTRLPRGSAHYIRPPPGFQRRRPFDATRISHESLGGAKVPWRCPRENLVVATPLSPYMEVTSRHG